ncbi:hypothetical protein [Bosea sp. NPDC055594]
MSLITAFLPTIRVWIFGIVVWLLARAGLPAEHAEPVTAWVSDGLALFVGIAYGAWASKREQAKGSGSK